MIDRPWDRNDFGRLLRAIGMVLAFSLGCLTAAIGSTEGRRTCAAGPIARPALL